MSSKTQYKEALIKANSEIRRLKLDNERLVKMLGEKVNQITNLQKEKNKTETILEHLSKKKWYEFWKK